MPRYLSPGGQQYRGDRGEADPGLAELLAAYQAGQQSEQAALTALSAARLLVPVVAVLAQAAHGAHSAANAAERDQEKDQEKDSEMMLPRLIGHDGRPAVPAFTSIDALARWREDARPVPAEADRVWRAAVADGCAVVIDVAGPVPLAVEGARLAALAAGRPVPPAHEDPDIRAAVEQALAEEPDITRFTLAPGHEGDLAVVLKPKTQDALPAASRAAQRIAAVLASRMRRGIEFSVAVASSTPPSP